MIITLIAGFGVGMFFLQARPYVAQVLDKAELQLAQDTLTLVTFALCLSAAGAVLSLIGADSYAVLLCLGAALGVARKPLMTRIRQGKGA